MLASDPDWKGSKYNVQVEWETGEITFEPLSIIADIGNAYLEALTDEKLYIVAGPEFQELEGYILIFLKALYGLKSSGKTCAEVICGILRDMKFYPQKLTHVFGSGKHPI